MCEIGGTGLGVELDPGKTLALQEKSDARQVEKPKEKLVRSDTHVCKCLSALLEDICLALRGASHHQFMGNSTFPTCPTWHRFSSFRAKANAFPALVFAQLTAFLQRSAFSFAAPFGPLHHPSGQLRRTYVNGFVVNVFQFLFARNFPGSGLGVSAVHCSRRKVHKFSVLFAPAPAASQCGAKVFLSAGNSAWKGGNRAYYVAHYGRPPLARSKAVVAVRGIHLARFAHFAVRSCL